MRRDRHLDARAGGPAKSPYLRKIICPGRQLRERQLVPAQGKTARRVKEPVARRIADKLGEPVVVGPEAVGLQPGILEPEDAEAERRVEDVGLDAVDCIVLDPLGWNNGLFGGIYEGNAIKMPAK